MMHLVLRKAKKQGKVIWSWYEHERDLPYPSKRVIFALKWFAKHYPLPDYGYTGDWREHLEYASDRMNGGRASAILRLIKESKKGEQ
jgi:hypothetical protein